MNATQARVPVFVRQIRAWPIGMLAGFAGGLAEVAWIVLYQSMAGHEAAVVARGVTQSLMPNIVPAQAAAPVGVAIHMGLAMVLGVVIAMLVSRVLPRIVGTAAEAVVVVGVLAGVWAVNFFVILPALNPDFVSLVPYGVSFTSKVLFGFAAAFVFWCAQRFRSSQAQRL